MLIYASHFPALNTIILLLKVTYHKKIFESLEGIALYYEKYTGHPVYTKKQQLHNEKLYKRMIIIVCIYEIFTAIEILISFILGIGSDSEILEKRLLFMVAVWYSSFLVFEFTMVYRIHINILETVHEEFVKSLDARFLIGIIGSVVHLQKAAVMQPSIFIAKVKSHRRIYLAVQASWYTVLQFYDTGATLNSGLTFIWLNAAVFVAVMNLDNSYSVRSDTSDLIAMGTIISLWIVFEGKALDRMRCVVSIKVRINVAIDVQCRALGYAYQVINREMSSCWQSPASELSE